MPDLSSSLPDHHIVVDGQRAYRRINARIPITVLRQKIANLQETRQGIVREIAKKVNQRDELDGRITELQNILSQIIE